MPRGRPAPARWRSGTTGWRPGTTMQSNSGAGRSTPPTPARRACSTRLREKISSALAVGERTHRLWGHRDDPGRLLCRGMLGTGREASASGSASALSMASSVRLRSAPLHSAWLCLPGSCSSSVSRRICPVLALSTDVTPSPNNPRPTFKDWARGVGAPRHSRRRVADVKVPARAKERCLMEG